MTRGGHILVAREAYSSGQGGILVTRGAYSSGQGGILVTRGGHILVARGGIF